MSDEQPTHDPSECSACAAFREQLIQFDRRLLVLEIIVRGEDGHNGMKSQLNKLCDRFDKFEKKAIRWIAIGTSLPGVVVAVVAVLRFLGRL
jgi:hypothetical protein